MMARDLTGGLEPSLDYPILEQSDVPGFGENHAFWIFDDAGEFFLNFHLQNVSGLWGVWREWGYLVSADGRALVVQREGSATGGKCVGAASAVFCCEEPFVRWTGRFRGTARDTTLPEIAAAPLVDGPRAALELRADAEMALEPWVQGGISAAAKKAMSGEAGRFIGGFRYEQLFRASVRASVDRQAHEWSATGLRTHRAGPRQMAAMIGHSWATAIFPGGRAFGLMRFPKPDGSVGFSEAWIFRNGERLEAAIVESPWLDCLEPGGETFRLKLESRAGTTVIDGETAATVFVTQGAGDDLGYIRPGVHTTGALVLGQSMARYRWDDEETYDLLERSAPLDKLRSSS